MKPLLLAPWVSTYVRSPRVHMESGTLIRHTVLVAQTKVYTPFVAKVTSLKHGNAYVTMALYGPTSCWDRQEHLIYSGPDLPTAIKKMDGVVCEKTTRSSGPYTEMFPAVFRDVQRLIDTFYHLTEWWSESPGRARPFPTNKSMFWRNCCKDLHIDGSDLTKFPRTEQAATLPEETWQMLMNLSSSNKPLVCELQSEYVRDLMVKSTPATRTEHHVRHGL